MPLAPIVALVRDTMPPPAPADASARRQGAPRPLPASFSESIFVAAPPRSAAPPPSPELVDAAGHALDAIAASRVARVSLAKAEREPIDRVECRWGRVDDVLGGGVPMRRVVLLGGMRGGGKTSLTLPVAGGVARASGRPVLYVSAEGQSPGELLMSLPPEMPADLIEVLPSNDLADIQTAIDELDPAMVAVDSMQSINVPGCRIGGDDHARAFLGAMRAAAREGNRCVWALSQMNAEGGLRGTQIYQQLCDTILMLERDDVGSRRVLKVAGKNRGGPDDRAAPFSFDDFGVLRGIGGEVG